MLYLEPVVGGLRCPTNVFDLIDSLVNEQLGCYLASIGSWQFLVQPSFFTLIGFIPEALVSQSCLMSLTMGLFGKMNLLLFSIEGSNELQHIGLD